MSTTVDQQVVEMRFDNGQFERGVSSTMSSLDKLKQGLNLSGASKGLENVGAAAKGINLSGLIGAAETVGLKFNAMYTIADQALRNITNSAYNAGKRIVSALTIDPIKTGLSEYETQIGAVQTILANTESKGSTLQDVNRALDELNVYADKTIYNFTEMTRNIGTFTAAGVDLDTSVNAIQGIANLAAVSGSTSQQASTAMYQLSQALSSGTVKLMDWNSVVNAGMGGQVFQDALKETSKRMAENAESLKKMSKAQRKAYQDQHGYTDEQMKSMMSYTHNVDELIEANGSFRESLQAGWITADVLTETLSHFTMAAEEGSKQWEAYKKSLMDDGYTEEQATAILKLSNSATDAATKVKTATQLWDTLKETAQSGWTQSWEIILGDFGEAKKLFSGIYETLSPMLEASAKARNDLLSEGLSTGWKQLLDQGIADEEGYKDSIKSVAKEHGVAIDDMIKAEKELDTSLSDEEAFQNVLKKGLADGSITSDMLSESVTNLADKMRGMTDAEREAAGYTEEHIAQIEALEAGLKDGSISMDEFVKKIQRPSGRENLIEALYNAFKAVMSVVTPVKEAFRDIFPPATGEQLYALTEKIRDFTAKLKLGETASENLKRTFKGVFAVVDIIRQVFVAAFDIISPLFGKVDDLGGGILGVTANIGDWLVSLNEAIKKNNVFGIAVEKVHSAFAKVKEFLQPVIDGIKEFGAVIGNTFVDISSKVPERLGPLATLGNAIKAVFVGLGNAIKAVTPWVYKAATGIGNVLKELVDMITTSIQNTDYDKLFDFANGGIITAIGVFIAKFVKSGGDLLDGAGGFLDGIQDVLGGVTDALGTFQESLKADVLKKIAIAIGILAASLLVLSLIPSDKLTASLLAVTTLFGELMASMAIFSKLGDLKGIGKIATALISLSASLLVLSIALKIMSTMSWKEMGVGLISMVVGLGALVGAVNLLPKKRVNAAAKAIKKMSSAILVLAVAIKIMSTMSWEEMGIGLISMVVGLGALVTAVNLLPKDTALRAAGMIGLATAMVILSGALKIMATMTWEEIGRGLATLAGSLFILSGAMALMKRSIPGALAMLIIAPALVVLAGALKLMSTMSWEEIAKGLVTLAGSLLIIAGAMALMRSALPGAAALLVVTAALAVLAPVLKLLGSMSWEEIAKGLTLLAGTFTVLGIAGAILGPLVPTILSLSGALVMLGAACLAIGAGVLALGLGLTAIAAAGSGAAAAIVAIQMTVIGLIPYLIEQIGVGLIRLCEVISGSASAICDAFTVIILALVDALVASVPALVEGAFVLIESLMQSLVDHTPTIVAALYDFLIGIINSIAEKLPDLIKAGVNLLMALFVGVVEALKGIDTGVLMQGILAVGLLTAITIALAAVAVLTPAAMVGVLGLGAVVTELAIVLAAIGALAQIPGLEWLISEGGQFMQTIGTAIGQFIGGIVGGFGQGLSSSLPQIGTDLSSFMTNAQAFIEGAKSIDASTMDGVKSLIGVILALTAADILDGLTSWVTGGSSLATFGEEIAAFGPNLKAYADSVAGIDAAAITASATAAQALAQMTSYIPNEGGLVAWFTGENSISKFGTELVTLGMGLKMYSLAITGFNSEAVIASANAAKALADMTSYIPNEGGLVAWFTGENSIVSFSSQLVTLGMGLRAYSVAIAGFNAEAVVASANAAKALADMTSCIPNQGGVAAWFAGENSIVGFSSQLVMLGFGLKGFSMAIAGINVEAMTSAANAAKTLAQMVSYIPNEGGIVAWFTGENSLSKFSGDLVSLGKGLKGFSDEVAGINAENVTAAANAAKTLGEMASYVPNEGGLVAWFTGENSVSKFAGHLPELGKGLKGFSESVAGIVPENITSAANAAKTLAEMTKTAPKDTSKLTSFGTNLVTFGEKLSSYFEKISGITAEAISNSSKAISNIKSSTTGLNAEQIKQASTAIGEMVKTINKLSKVSASSADGFSAAIKKLGETNVKALITAFNNAGDDMKKAGQTLAEKFLDGIENQHPKLKDAGETAIEKFVAGVTNESTNAKDACIKMVERCAATLKNVVSEFKSAGAYLVKGFANGISANTYLAKAKARAMANAAADAAKKALDEHSPSKVGYEIGDFFGVAFVNGIGDWVDKAYKVGTNIGGAAKNGLTSAVSRISDFVNTDIDSQPTIRPVLDLSDVRAGAGTIGSLFGNGITLGVRTNVGAISSMMAARNQNGANDDIVSELSKLRNDMQGVRGDTYSINGINVSGDEDVSNAMKVIVRAARIGGRV